MSCSNYALNSTIYHSVKGEPGMTTSDVNTHIVCLLSGLSSTKRNVIPPKRPGTGHKKMQRCSLSRSHGRQILFLDGLVYDKVWRFGRDVLMQDIYILACLPYRKKHSSTFSSSLYPDVPFLYAQTHCFSSVLCLAPLISAAVKLEFIMGNKVQLRDCLVTQTLTLFPVRLLLLWDHG